MTITKCETDGSHPSAVRSSRNHLPKVTLFAFGSFLWASFFFAPVQSIPIILVPAVLSAFAAFLAFNVRINVVIDPSDRRIYVTRRGPLRNLSKIWYPYNPDKLSVQKLRCFDPYHYYQNYFVVLSLTDQDIPIFQHPQQDVAQRKLSQIIDSLA